MLKPLMASLFVLSTFASAFASSDINFACNSMIETEEYLEGVPGASVVLNFDHAKVRIKQLIAAGKPAEAKVSFSENYPYSWVEAEVKITSPCTKEDLACETFNYTTTIKHFTIQSGKSVTQTFTGSVADFPESFPGVDGSVEEGFKDDDNVVIKSITANCGKVSY